MQATVVDLRYRMKRVLEALNRSEPVTVLCRGKIRGTIIPAGPARNASARKHQSFGMLAKDKRSVREIMDELRGGRPIAL